MEQIWWKQVTKASNFIDIVTSTALQNKSIVLEIPIFVPWYETMCEIVEDILNKKNPENRLDFIDCPEQNVGQYLLENYCKKEKRASYRYGMSYATFLAKSDDIVLNNYYIWVKNVSKKKLEEWIKFIEEYNKNLPSHMLPAIFILETSEKNNRGRAAKGIQYIRFSDNIEAYDRFAFCALASTNIAIKTFLRPYLVELVSTICCNDVELCAKCIEKGINFMKEPVETLRSIIATAYHSDGSAFVMNLEASYINNLLWESQIKLIFPIIEKYRSKFVKRHHIELLAALPVTNAFGEVISNPQDIELGLLTHLVSTKYISLNKRDYNELELFRKARNNLAHLIPLEFDIVEQILLFRD